MHRATGIAVLVLLIGLAFFGSIFPADNWHRIGVQKVSRSTETDSISVDRRSNFRFIRLKVLNAGVIIEGWKLEFRDGSTQHVPFFGYAAANLESPAIPVTKKLKKVHFKYRSQENSKGAKIELYGRE